MTPTPSIIDKEHEYSVSIPKVTPNGQVVKTRSVELEGGHVLHAESPDQSDLYFEVTTHSGVWDHGELVEQQQSFLRQHSADGQLTTACEKEVEGYRGTTFGFRGTLQGRRKERQFLFIDGPRHTYRIVYDPTSALNQHVLRSLKLSAIPALVPRKGRGHQFVFYGDCCSGIPTARHEATFASVNSIISRLQPQPQFICFLGDEIQGLVTDEQILRRQWRYWFEQEMAWLDRDAILLYHTTGNHTTYDALSEAVFRDVLARLPRNGPPGQEGLSYFVRRKDLLMIFVNTMWSELGDGRVETTWLDKTLAAHPDARYKIVFGHHPAYPLNGFAGDYQRNLDAENRRAFWQVLVRHKVMAYVCSHILAFDVQVHDGVLQIATAGAGTLPHMPEDIEYLHCVQAALDDGGLRYQVLDTSGQPREWLAWPLKLPHSTEWTRLACGDHTAPAFGDQGDDPLHAQLVAWRFDGSFQPASHGGSQTLLCGWTPGPGLAPLWIGFQGFENRLYALLSAAPGKSPHYWLGPTLPPDSRFSIQIAIHTGMGPGGLLWRWDDSSPWSSLVGATPWGAERLSHQTQWSVGHDQYGPDGRPFRGGDLAAKWYTQELGLHPILKAQQQVEQ